MSGESIPTGAPPPEKPINWNEILRHSFMFSQGVPDLQRKITAWIAQGPLQGKNVDASSFTPGMISTYVRESPDHSTRDFVDDEILLDEERERTAALMKEVAEHTEPANIGAVAAGMLERDLVYMQARNGRPVQRESGRDKWASFIIDFGVLQRGVSPWTYDSMPAAYKELWTAVVEELESGKYSTQVAQLVQPYLEKHWKISDEDRAKIEAFARAAAPKAATP